MTNNQQIAVIEKNLIILEPQFSQVLTGTGLSPERLMRTVLISVERLPALLECTMPSVLNSAMTAAVLGLEVDGVTGQAFMIPFKDNRAREKRAQLIIGYKGYNTMGARSGYTINGGVVREGDDFEYMEGTNGYVRNKRRLGKEGQRSIIAAWAQADQPGRTPIIAVVSVDELLATKARSPGASRSDSPWNEPGVGYPAMCEKTAKRRLARSMPLNIMQYAAAMEDQADLGKYAYIQPGGKVVIEGSAHREVERTLDDDDLAAPRFQILGPEGEVLKDYPDIISWQKGMNALLRRLAGNAAGLQAMAKANAATLRDLALVKKYPEAVRIVDLLGKEGIELEVQYGGAPALE